MEGESRLTSFVLSPSIKKALQKICFLLADLQGEWLVGGSCGLLMQKVEVLAEPRDLDVYTDGMYIENIAAILHKYALDNPQYSESLIYRSNLSHYNINGVVLELVGDFEVKSEGSSYRVEISQLMKDFNCSYSMDTCDVKLMPLAHELVFNLLRNRPDRYQSIAKVMKLYPDDHIPVLIQIIKRNDLSRKHIKLIKKLLGNIF